MSLAKDAEALLEQLANSTKLALEGLTAHIALQREKNDQIMAKFSINPDHAELFLEVAKAGERYAAELIAYAAMMKRHARRAVGDGGVS